MGYQANPALTHKFTGKERDTTRQQPFEVKLGTTTNAVEKGQWQFRFCGAFGDASCSANNGNVLGQIHTIGAANFNQTYQYDSLNRICSVRETASTTPLGPRNCGDVGGVIGGEAWYQAFTHDRYGNLATPTDPNINVHPLTVRSLSDYDTATNRLKTLSGIWNYDAAGNLTKHGAWTLAYDAENRQKTSQPSGGSVTTYDYDGDGRRVKKTTGASSTWFIYDASGQLAAEYTSAGPTGSGATHYLTTDHLGSTRLVTDASKNVISRHDYLPFGYEIYTGITSRTTAQGYSPNPSTLATPTQRFTGKERDTETGLDYFGARYLSGAMGRFTGPDEPLVDQHTEDAQSWNLYGYVRNNPLKYHDADGRVCLFGIGNTCNEDVPNPPQPPPPPAAPINPVFPTVDAAATAAARLNQAGQQRTGGEHGSSVHTVAGGVAFTYTDPVTQGMPTRVDPHNTTGNPSPRAFSILDPPIPGGEVLVAETHSHPRVVAMPDGSPKPIEQQLSFNDKNRSNTLGMFHKSFQGMYVGLPDGRVIKHNPRAPEGKRVTAIR
ncbi:MAG: RHS repeat-associated core domain-containing protein [Bryobacterales bacterium]|nr:RHS repeat-associated core domain-containing protein [Bryobacterales bacterium]